MSAAASAFKSLKSSAVFSWKPVPLSLSLSHTHTFMNGKLHELTNCSPIRRRASCRKLWRIASRELVADSIQVTYPLLEFCRRPPAPAGTSISGRTLFAHRLIMLRERRLYALRSPEMASAFEPSSTCSPLACGVDNCCIEIDGSSNCDRSVEVPIFDGSAKEWVEAIYQSGLKEAVDTDGKSCQKLAPYLSEPVYVRKGDAFVAAIPYSRACITYGIDYPQAPAIGCQWFSSMLLDESFYSSSIAPSRTFCIYEEVERMRSLGLIKGGSAETAIVCSMSKGWLNPPLRYDNEPCRHKVLDLIGDISLLAQEGNQGLLVAHIVAYKGGHSLHADFVRRLLGDGVTQMNDGVSDKLTP